MGLHLASKLRMFVESLHAHYNPETLDELVSELESWTARVAALESAVTSLVRANSPAPVGVEHENQGVAPAQE